MSTQALIRLTECDVMLAEIGTRYATAIRRLREADDGFPGRTPGSGEPGGGKGFTAGSITERLATNPSTYHAQYIRALRLPYLIADHAADNARGATITMFDIPTGPRITLRKLVWARWLIRQLIDQQHPAPNAALEKLHRHVAELAHITSRWGQPLHTPKRTDQLPADPTERWCTSCLRIAIHSPRRRGDRCGWCYDFELVEHFVAPVELLERRHRGKRIYDRDIEPFRKAWREKQKRNKRKKAG